MWKTIVIGLALNALTVTGTAAMAPPQTQALAVAPAPRPLHAVLRYDPALTAGCQSFSSGSPELCLLLALHIIRMSQKPLAGAAVSDPQEN